jgi:hypothetical protein
VEANLSDLVYATVPNPTQTVENTQPFLETKTKGFRSRLRDAQSHTSTDRARLSALYTGINGRSGVNAIGSNRLKLAIGKPDHLQQQPAVAKAGDLGFADGARLVMDRRFMILRFSLAVGGLGSKPSIVSVQLEFLGIVDLRRKKGAEFLLLVCPPG